MKQSTFRDFSETKEVAEYFDKQEENQTSKVHKFSSVKEKIKNLDLGPKPYFLPVLAGSTPYWKHPSVLVSWDRLPPVKQRLPYDYNKTLIMVESGGYLEDNKPSTQEECMMKQMRIHPDLCLVLDFPVKIKSVGKGRELAERRRTFLLPESEKIKLIQKTIDSAKFAMEHKEKLEELWNHIFEPVAIIHSYDKKSLVWCTEELFSLGYEFFCIGGISTDVAARNVQDILSMLDIVRSIIGEGTWIHLLGITELRILKRVTTNEDQSNLSSFMNSETNDEDDTKGFVELLTETKDLVNSFDSASITWQAAYAKLILPDGSATSLGKGRKALGERYADLYPRDASGYMKLQEINFSNFMEYLHSNLWKDK